MGVPVSLDGDLALASTETPAMVEASTTHGGRGLYRGRGLYQICVLASSDVIHGLSCGNRLFGISE